MRALVVVMLFVVAAATWFLTMSSTDPGLALTGSEPLQGSEVRPGTTADVAATAAPEANVLPTGTVAIRIMRARKRLFSALQHHLGRLRRPPACFQ